MINIYPYFVVGSRQIPLYGCFAALGALAAILYILRYERCHKEYAADIDLALIYGLIGGVVGAKLFYILVNIKEFISEFQYLFSDTVLFLTNYLSGGFVYFGGLFGYIAAVRIYARKAHVPTNDALSPAVPALALFHAFGRIGCFFAGCCYGKMAVHTIGIVNHFSQIAPNGIPLIPVQLYESATEFVIFAILLSLQNRQASGYKILNTYLLLYASARFLLEFLRGDIDRGFVGVLSVSQIIALIVIVFIGFRSIILPRRKRGT